MKLRALLPWFLSVPMATALPLAAQQPSKVIASCVEFHRHIVPKPGTKSKLRPDRLTLQWRSGLNKNETVFVYEHPETAQDVDVYGTRIVIENGQYKKAYRLASLIRGGEVLRLTEAASFCTSPDDGVLFLAFQGGNTGSAVGFVRVSFSATGAAVEPLPMTEQGRIVVAKDSSSLELWSGSDEDTGIVCNTCEKKYLVRECKVAGVKLACSRAAKSMRNIRPPQPDANRISVR